MAITWNFQHRETDGRLSYSSFEASSLSIGMAALPSNTSGAYEPLRGIMALTISHQRERGIE